MAKPSLLSKWLKRFQYSVLIAVAAGVFALAAIGGFKILSGDDAPERESGLATGTAPAEYLYLDTARVLAYLSQFEGGELQSETRTFSETDQLSSEATVGESFKVGASAQRQRSIVGLVLTNAPGNYFRLLEHLMQDDHEQTRFEQDISLHSEDDFRRIDGGDFVEIHTIELRRPDYLGPYITARQAGTLEALFPKSASARRETRAFVRRVGPNPRFTFAIGETGEHRFLMPVNYESLSDERSLYSADTRLTIVGKVVRRFKSTAGSDELQGPRYVDEATRETWRLPIKEVPRPLLREVDPTCTWTTKPRECLLRNLQRQTVVPVSGAVIIPIAIYK